MSRRRRRSSSNSQSPRTSMITAASCRPVLEKLETRRLFTTIITDTDPLTPIPDERSFEYKDARDKLVRVTVHGDVAAEFIFARVTRGPEKTTAGWNEVVLGEYVGTTAVDKDGKLILNPENGRDLFHVYVAQSTIDSYIAIAEVGEFDAQNRPMLPFDGRVTLNINQLTGDSPTINTTADTGEIYLGARTLNVEGTDPDEGDVPLRGARFNGQGIAPVTIRTKTGRLVAGMTVANENNLGRFMFGGTVSGRVAVTGSMDTFYCGQLLTGVTEGQFFRTSGPDDENNFAVNGDLRNLLVKGAVGTEDLPDGDDRDNPRYLSGVDIQVGGKVGQIRSGSDYTGFGEIINTAGPGLGTMQAEIERRIVPGANRGSFSDFQNGEFGDGEAFFVNDTFENPQFLGSITHRKTGENSIFVGGLMQWVGKLEDVADYYGVALMAGQTVSVRLSAPFPSFGGFQTNFPSDLQVGVFDPDKRLIATDWSNVAGATATASPTQHQTFTFTADRPGVYRIAVGYDPTFAAPGLKQVEQPYNIRITGVGNMGLGGLFVGDEATGADTLLSTSSFFFDARGREQAGPATISVVNGDLGALHSPGFILSGFGGLVSKATFGNLRSIEGLSLGHLEGGFFGSGPEIQVLTGSVGLIRSAGAVGGANFTDFNTLHDTPIAGDVQLFESNNTTAMNLRVNGSIGTIRVNNMAVATYTSTIAANVDGQGAPATIDLIDCDGDFGTLGLGGPDVSTNIGGNVRYIRVGGQAFRPRTFGGGLPEETTYARGQKATITDDSGTNITLTPTQAEILDPLTGIPVLDPLTGLPIDDSGTLTITTYPISPNPFDQNTGIGGGGGGGSVIINVTSTKGVRIDASGTSAEIGQIVSQGTGPSIIRDLGADFLPNTGDEDLGPDGLPNTGDDPFVLDPLSFLDNSIQLNGADGAIVDVFDITGNGFNEIRNNTIGEIVNTDIGSIGRLEANTLGLARSSINPYLAVERIDLADNSATTAVEGSTFPWVQGKTGVSIRGAGATQPTAVDIRARRGLGNLMLFGAFQEIRANADGRSESRIFEGINAPIFCEGQIRELNIGEGVLPSGTGDMARSGVYCLSNEAGLNAGGGRIERVVNQGVGSDIRGTIVANSGIGEVLLNGGSIINAEISVMLASGTNTPGGPGVTATFTGADFISTREFGSGRIIRQGTDINGNELGNVDGISITGAGGIIGMLTTANNIGNITVDGGFGIFNSFLSTLGDGRIGAISATGFGIRGVSFDGGQSVQSLTAIGQGRANVMAYSPSIRMSDIAAYDPYSGQNFSELNDLHRVLGTSAEVPVIRGASNAGVIDNTDVRVSRDVSSISASQLRTVTFNVPNLLGTLHSRDYIIGGTVTAGRVDTISIGGDSSRFSINVAGPIGLAAFGKSMRGTTTLAASGPAGRIDTLIVKGSLYGNVTATQGIGTIDVRKHLGSLNVSSGKGLNLFTVGGSIVTGARITVAGALNELRVGGDVLDGVLVDANPLVKKTVNGSDLGEYI